MPRKSFERNQISKLWLNGRGDPSPSMYARCFGELAAPGASIVLILQRLDDGQTAVVKGRVNAKNTRVYLSGNGDEEFRFPWPDQVPPYPASASNVEVLLVDAIVEGGGTLLLEDKRPVPMLPAPAN